MPANLRIVPYNFHNEAALVTQFAPLPGFSIDNTKDTMRSYTWRSPDGTDQYVGGRFTDGIVRTVSFVGFFRHRCHGGSVRVVLYSDNAFSTIAYDSGVVPINNVTVTEGLDTGKGTIDPFLTRAPFWLWITPTPCLSYRIYFSSNSGAYGYPYWQVCRIVVGPKFELAYNPQYGYGLGRETLSTEQRTGGGSSMSNRRASYRVFKADIDAIPEGDRAAWFDLMEELDTSRDFVVSFWPGDGTRLERDYTANVKFSAIDPLVRRLPYWHKKSIQMKEV